MSNAFFIWPLIYILLSRSVLAGQHSMVSLSPQVASVVPRCAHRCLELFIAQNFPKKVCHNRKSLDCLCSRRSVSGLTLGEGALRCAASDCSRPVLEDHVDIYELCKDISSAKPMTHGTLTATRAIITTVATSSHTRRVTTVDSTGLSLSIPSSITAPNPGISAIPLPTSLALAHSWTSSSSSCETFSPIPSSSEQMVSPSSTISSLSSASFSAAPAPKAALTKPQIAGVTVAGVASAALTFGVLFCIFCIRRRKSQKRFSGSSFGGDNVIQTRPGSPGLPLPTVRDPEGDSPAHGLPISEGRRPGSLRSARDKNRWSLSKRNTRPEDIGVAVAHGTHLEPTPVDTPVSSTSYRTTSQLLPDKPVYSLFPPRPHRLRVVNPENSPVSPQTPDSSNALSPVSAGIGRPSRSASRGRNTLDTSQRFLQGNDRNIHQSTSDPFLDSHSDGGALIYAGESNGLGATAWTRSLETLRKPVPARQYQKGQTHQPTMMISQPKVQMRDPSVVGRRTFGVPPGQIKSTEQAIRSKTKGKSSVDRPSTFYSTASETSFEDAGDEDGMPTRHSVLSPVAESPKPRSPLGAIRYPKVPALAAPFECSRGPSPESPTPRPPPKNPLRAIVTQQPHPSRFIPGPDVAELPGSPVTSPVSPLARRNDNSQAPDSPRSAKWRILVGSGLEGIENFGAQSPRATEPRPFG